ncbi:MAG: alpha-glucosidase/alpha-galactosidase, partial [Clostridia bacterium]
MLKITFIGAGSTVFAKNVLGDIMLSPSLCHAEIALYDISPERLSESEQLICALNETCNESRATIKTYLGVENRREALR